MHFCITVTTYNKFYKFCDFCIKKDNLRFSRWAAFFHVIVLKQVFEFFFWGGGGKQRRLGIRASSHLPC